MKVYYDATQISIESLRGNLQMAGMGRLARAWGERLRDDPEAALVSGLPAGLVEEALRKEPTLAVTSASSWVAGKSTWWEGSLKKLIIRGGRDRSLASRIFGFSSFHLAMKLGLGRVGKVIEAQSPGTDPCIYHIVLSVKIPQGLPENCIPVIHIHDIIPLVFRDTYSKKGREAFVGVIRSVKAAKAHVTVGSINTKHSLVCYFDLPADRIHVVPLGSDPKPAATESRSALPSGGTPFFLYVASSGQRRKNVEGAMLGFEQFLHQSGESAELIIVGKDTGIHQQQGDRLMQNLPGRIRCLGNIGESQLEQLYANAKVGLYVSLYEGFGLPILEYMTRGVPVICGNETSLPEVAGDAALLVDPLNPAAIGAAMEQLWADADLRNALIERGRRRAAEFSWEASYAHLKACYAKILGGATPHE